MTPDTQTESPENNHYEDVYYVGTRGPPPPRSGLPLLPSRSDRFRIYFSADRSTLQRRPTQVSPEEEPVYENIT